MDNSVRISVIIAVYKGEQYIARCIESLQCQTFKDFEILLVDDGSPDNSGAICDKYAANDTRIRVFHKKNGGVGSARQCGMDNARGEYTIHVDPDDWVEPTMLEELYKAAVEEDADMVICDFLFDINGKVCYESQTCDDVSCDNLFRKFMKGDLHGSLCNKLIKRSCYLQYDIKFPTIIIWEDLFVICSLLLHDLRVCNLKKAFYHYDQSINEISITKKSSRRKFDSQVYFLDYFQSVLDDSKYKDELICVKGYIKDLAWDLNFTRDEFLELYSELNPLIVSGRFSISSIRFYEKLYIQGHERLSRILYKILFCSIKPLIKRVYYQLKY